MKTDLTVCGLLVHNKKVLLIHQKKLNKWLPPGGHIEPNETPDQTVVRELQEEVGIPVTLSQKQALANGEEIREQCALPFYANVHSVGDHDHYCLFYLCTTTHPEQLTLEKRAINEARWFTAEDIQKENILENVKQISLLALKLAQE